MKERVLNFDPWTGEKNNEIKPEDVRRFFNEYVAKIVYKDIDPADPAALRIKYRRAFAFLGDAKVEPMPPDPDSLDNPTEEDLQKLEDIVAILTAAQIQFCRWVAEGFLY